MTTKALTNLVHTCTGAHVRRQTPLSGGCVSNVLRLDLEDGRSVVLKQGGNADLELEARMLRYFAEHSPIACPEVIYADARYLIMTFVPNDNVMSESVQRDLAEKLAQQHLVRGPRFGLPFDTLIGGLPQPNRQEKSWVTFFGEQRLRHMAQAACQAGQLPAGTVSRIDRLIEKLGELIPDTAEASLLHGDLWGGNILSQAGKLAALVDPAIYYGDREIELAFGTLFGDLGPEFFARYTEIFPLENGFFEERRDLYNLYPLLVHVHLFGGAYLGAVDRTLSRFGV